MMFVDIESACLSQCKSISGLKHEVRSLQPTLEHANQTRKKRTQTGGKSSQCWLWESLCFVVPQLTFPLFDFLTFIG